MMMRQTVLPIVAARRFVLLVACAASAATAACGGAQPAAHDATPASVPTVETVRVVQQPVNLTLELPGELAPYQTVAVFPKVTGFVKTIAVDRGAVVRTGQVLATLDAPELLSQRAEAQSKLQAARAQLAAAQSKADAETSTYAKLKAASATPGVVAGNDLTIAAKALEADQNQVTALQQNAEAARQAVSAVSELEAYLKVTAPFDGVVTERNVHPGALVGPSSGATSATPLFRIVDSSRLRLIVPVPEAYVGGVQQGVAVPFAVAALPGVVLNGTIARISRVVDAKTRTMAVELEVPNGDRRLAPGSFCQVRWPVRRDAPSLLVPARSVASTTGRTFVVRIRDGHAEWVDVKTGLSSGPLVEVFGDIHAGDTVAARGTDEIRPGADVRAVDSTGRSGS